MRPREDRGERIAFVHNLTGYGDDVAWNEEIYVASIDGTGLFNVSNRPGNDHWPPAWSADSRCLAWQADDADASVPSANIHVVVVDGSGSVGAPVTVTDDVELFPTCAPDDCEL